MFLPHWSEYALHRGILCSAQTIGIALFAMALLGGGAPCRADGGRSGVNNTAVDTEDLFGFIEGTDIGAAGERELDVDSTVRLGRGTGSFTDSASEFE
jgi:hypothetical protein